MGASGRTEAAIGNVCIHICVIGTVEEIEELEAHLEIHAFSDVNVLVHVGIGLKEVRLSELHRSARPCCRAIAGSWWRRGNRDCCRPRYSRRYTAENRPPDWQAKDK